MRKGSRPGTWLAPLVFTISCGVDTPVEPLDSADAPEPSRLTSVDPVPEELPAIVARVNRHRITSDELERAVRSAEIEAGQALPAQLRDQVYRAVLDRLVAFHVLLQESEALSVSAEAAAVDARIEDIRSSFPTNEAFEDQLSAWETTLDALHEETRRDLLVERLLKSEVLSDIDIDTETVREFYDLHTEQFVEGGAVEARHILIGNGPDASDRERTSARKRAENIRRQVEDGADFSELARAHSEDPGSAANGGALGLVARGQTAPEFEAALFSLEPGGISEVIETAFGFHVIQMVRRRAEHTASFAEASIQIRELLTQEEQRARTTAYVDELKAKSDIEILI